MNKKIIALLLGAALTTGIGGFGTYAYFTDREDVKNNVNITMGRIEASTNWEGSSWNAVSAQNEARSILKDGSLTFENVKPGDYFYRDIIVENTGSLVADTIITLNESFSADLNTSFVVNDGSGYLDHINPSRVEVKNLAPGAKLTVRVTIEVPTEFGNAWSDKVFNAENHNFISVDMHQAIY